MNPEARRRSRLRRSRWARSGVDPRHSTGLLDPATPNDALPDAVHRFSEAPADHRLDSDAPTLEEVLMSVDQIPLSALAVTPVHSVSPSDTGRRAGALMDEFNVDQLPVVEQGNRLRGVVTRRRLWRELSWREVDVSEILDVMPSARVRRSDTTLGEVFDLLFDHDFVLISDDDGHTVTAIVTINDVARHLDKHAD